MRLFAMAPWCAPLTLATACASPGDGTPLDTAGSAGTSGSSGSPSVSAVASNSNEPNSSASSSGTAGTGPVAGSGGAGSGSVVPTNTDNATGQVPSGGMGGQPDAAGAGSPGTDPLASGGNGVGGVVNVAGAGAGGTPGGFGGEAGGSSVAAGAGGSSGAGPALNCDDPPTLKEAGQCSGRWIGVALTVEHLSEPEYAERALHFDYVTPENEMKWDATEPTQGGFDFTLGDEIVEFAEANGMAVKGHTLVWHNQLPAWLTNMSDPNQVRSAMINHIDGLLDHYRGRVIAWDVVNEAMDDDGQLRDSLWSQTLGASFIEDAFRAAREADPNVKLYYNDYDIESNYAKTDAVYEMVRDLVENGVPIDGVGMQMHTRTTDEDPPVPEFQANLQRFVDLGLEVVISEMDVRLCEGGTFEQQRTRYHDLIEVCMAEPQCTAITIWGITDQYSFLNDRTDLQCAGAEPPRPLLWDDDYNEKPAFSGVMDALLGR